VVVPVPDQAADRLAPRAVIRAQASSLLFLVAILLWIRSKIGYNVSG
jgi:hypothetical protein